MLEWTVRKGKSKVRNEKGQHSKLLEDASFCSLLLNVVVVLECLTLILRRSDKR